MGAFISDAMIGDRDAIIWAAAVYFVICGILGAVFAHRMNNWPSVIGRLEDLGVDQWGVASFSPDEREYALSGRYHYRVDGQEYSSDRIDPWLMTATYNLRFILNWRLQRIARIGDDGIRVFYNPRKPQKAFLIQPGHWGVVVILGLCWGAAALMFAALS